MRTNGAAALRQLNSSRDRWGQVTVADRELGREEGTIFF
jgi:hypothetical protein